MIEHCNMKILKIVDELTNGIHRKNPQRRYIESRKRICESGMNKITIWKFQRVCWKLSVRSPCIPASPGKIERMSVVEKDPSCSWK
jgi:hypothetical protein